MILAGKIDLRKNKRSWYGTRMNNIDFFHVFFYLLSHNKRRIINDCSSFVSLSKQRIRTVKELLLQFVNLFNFSRAFLPRTSLSIFHISARR